MRQSLSISHQVLGSLEVGPVSLLLHCGHCGSISSTVYHSFEAPKGEMGVYMVYDAGRPISRCKVRAPGYFNLSGLA